MTPSGPTATWTWRDALPVVGLSFVALLVGGVVVVSVGGYRAGDTMPIAAQFLATVPFWITAVAGVAWVSRRDPEPRRALGLVVRPLDVVVGAACGVATQLLVLPVLYWPILRLTGQDYDDVEAAARKLADSATGAVGVTLFVLMACLFAPVAEELLYRGLLLRSSGWTAPAALGVTTVIFACSHLQGLQLPGLVVFGLVAGILAQRTGRLAPAIAAHVAFNTTSVVGLLWHR